MIQIFAFGSSSVYGVGGTDSGWAGLVKAKLHKKMFAEDGVGEKYEFFNFGKSGATISFVLNTFAKQLEDYGRSGEAIAIVAVGGNNSKAEDTPDNFISTPKEYREEMNELLGQISEKFTHVLFLGSGYVDESKTNPKPNPLTGGCSYFTNSKRQEFDVILKEVCQAQGVTYLDVDVSENEWVAKYVSVDGLHPNDDGYELLANKVWAVLEPLLD